VLVLLLDICKLLGRNRRDIDHFLSVACAHSLPVVSGLVVGIGVMGHVLIERLFF
jgi:hypothetical protein